MVINSIKKFFGLLNKEEKSIFVITMILSIITSFLEGMSIAIIIPILSILTEGNFINDSKFINLLFNFFFIDAQYINNKKLIIYILFLFGFIFFLKYLIKYLHIIYKFKLNKNFNFLTQQKLLKKYLFRPWRITKEKKPSTYLRNIQNEVSEVNTRILNSFVSLFPDIFLFIVIIVLLLSYSPEITLTLFGIMAVIGILTNKYFDKKISKLASNRMIITKINYSYLIEMMKF